MADISFKTFTQKMQTKGLSPKAILSAWTQYQKTGILPQVLATDMAGDKSVDRNNRNPYVTGGRAVPDIGGLMGQAVGRAADVFKGGPFNDRVIGGQAMMEPSAYTAQTQATFDKNNQKARILQRQVPTDDYGLKDLLAGLDSNIGPASFQYNDFTDQANSIAAKNFAPQYQALQMAAQNAQSQYNRADPVIEGLYQKLSGDIRNQAQATQDQAVQQSAARGQQGQDLQGNIANTYASTQGNQAALLAQLGLQDAAPTTLQSGTNDSAWQQGQAATNTASAQDYITATGTNAANFQNQTADASQTQGVVARQNLLGQLSDALSQVDQQRLGVASDQSQAASTLGMQLSDRDYGMQKDVYSAATSAQQTAIDRMLQEYQLRSGIASGQASALSAADQQAWERAYKEKQLEFEAQGSVNDTTRANAAIITANSTAAKAGQLPQGNVAKMVDAMQPYGQEGLDALRKAQQVAANPSTDPSTPLTLNDYIAAVVAAGRTQQPPISDAASIEAATQMAASMSFANTPVTATR